MAAVMNCASDWLLSGSGFAKQQNCRIALGNRFDHLQNVLQHSAIPDNLLKTPLAADLFFEIELFLGKLVFQFGDFTLCQGIFDCEGDLYRSSAQEIDIIRCEWNLCFA